MPTESCPLSLLLDVSTVDSSTLIRSRFTEIAEALFYHYYLRIEHQGITTDFELLEVEFYIQKQGVHEDPFCHAHEDQQNPAQWYFHRAPRTNSSAIKSSVTPTTAQGYRGGTRKGLDLTFGAPDTSSSFPAKTSKPCRGGILLRSMRPCDGSAEVISGPSLLVDKIMSITESRNISELVTIKLGGHLSAIPPSGDSSALHSHLSRIYFTPRPRGTAGLLPSIHRSPRVGLDLSHPSVSPQSSNPRVIYLAKFYRYFVHPELLKAKGRCHTLIGLCLELSSDPINNPLDDKPTLVGSLAEAMGINRATIERYLDDYTEGFKNRDLIEYVGPLGKGLCSTPKLFMRMMGVLGRMGLLTSQDE